MVKRFKTPEKIIFDLIKGNVDMSRLTGEDVKAFDADAKDRTGRSPGFVGILLDIATGKPGSIIEQYTDLKLIAAARISSEVFAANQPKPSSHIVNLLGVANYAGEQVHEINNSGEIKSHTPIEDPLKKYKDLNEKLGDMTSVTDNNSNLPGKLKSKTPEIK